MVASLIAKGKTQGFLLSDDVLAVFPKIEDDIASVDELWSSLIVNGVDVVDQPPQLPSRVSLRQQFTGFWRVRRMPRPIISGHPPCAFLRKH